MHCLNLNSNVGRLARNVQFLGSFEAYLIRFTDFVLAGTAIVIRQPSKNVVKYTLRAGI